MFFGNALRRGGLLSRYQKSANAGASDAFLRRVAPGGNAPRAPGSGMTSSMYRDLVKGQPVEVDTILGDMLRRGKASGLKTPLLEAAFVNLSVYQQALAASGQVGSLKR